MARGESDKQAPFGKYVLPCAHLELGSYYTDINELGQAKNHLSKSQNGFKDYELESRIQTQVKSLQRRIKFLTDGPKLAASLKAKSETEQEQKNQKQTDLKNFYVS